MTEQQNKYEEIIFAITTPEDCEVMARNCEARGRSDLALLALQHSIELRAKTVEVETEPEADAVQSVYAFEETQYVKLGKRIRASKTWKMIKDHGVMGAVERIVNQTQETDDYQGLVDLGLEGFAFECVVDKYPDLFEQATVKTARARIKRWSKDSQAS